MKAIATHGVMEKADPDKSKDHLYGLPPERWRNLYGKSFWITGAGTGYGRCLAVAIASAGGQVFLTGRRRGKLLESIEEIREFGINTENCHVIEADIIDIRQMQSACNRVKNLCSSLYGLVNNAALPPRASLQNESIQYWDRLMRTNVTAPWLLTRAIFPHMMKGGAVRVLFVTSEAGWAFTPGFGPYNVSKAALNNLSASMGEEYAKSFPHIDIQMNALVAGEARTEMNQNSRESPYSIVSMALILLSQPRGGPNGKFFHRDGQHLEFTYASPYDKPLMQQIY
jgi:NAD(P)-dependent dehydrogenase (short-subunit alcohol dehydrogenase family)